MDTKLHNDGCRSMFSISDDAFTPEYMLLFTSCIHLYPLVAVDVFLVSATKLSPVCRSSVAGYKGIQVDRVRDINEY